MLFNLTISPFFRLSEIDDPIVDPGDDISDAKASCEAVGKSDQASQEGNPISDKELVEQREMRPDYWLTVRTDMASF
jgi:hypothetical protein